MGVSFHVGSQCMRPTAYQAAMAQASRALVRAGVFADVVDVGGGFPSVYPGMIPPDLGDYMDSIDRGFAEMMVHETTELWCEPGRALVAEGSSC
jgi:ornithine decarboxylase